MAILKHIASKNADYGEAQRYCIFQHDEYTGKPILDENGKMQLREEYYLDGIECDPFRFDMECRELNARFHKNQKYDEIKSHHYIISFDPKGRNKFHRFIAHMETDDEKRYVKGKDYCGIYYWMYTYAAIRGIQRDIRDYGIRHYRIAVHNIRCSNAADSSSDWFCRGLNYCGSTGFCP